MDARVKEGELEMTIERISDNLYKATADAGMSLYLEIDRVTSKEIYAPSKEAISEWVEVSDQQMVDIEQVKQDEIEEDDKKHVALMNAKQA